MAALTGAIRRQEEWQTQSKAVAAARPSLWRRIRSIHPGLVLATLDLIGFGIASYLSIEELTPGGEVLHDRRRGGSSTARTWRTAPIRDRLPASRWRSTGSFLSLTLFTLAIAWWRTNNYKLLLFHYGLSLVGVLFEGWFQFAQIFLIKLSASGASPTGSRSFSGS
jgi:hypothetical protein